MISGQYRTHSIDARISDSEIVETVKELLEWREQNRGKLAITFPNWNEDPRELWDIPEARTFALRLLDFGILAPLTTSTAMHAPGMEKDVLLKHIGFGALELFMFAYFPQAEITEEKFDMFVAELRRSNRICEEIDEGNLL